MHRHTWATVLMAGGFITLLQAVGRFGVFGLTSGLSFPPEVISQWFFAVIPMRMFGWGLAVFGKGAKWWALVGTTLIWMGVAGWSVYGLATAFRRVVQWVRPPVGHSVALAWGMSAAIALAVAMEWFWGLGSDAVGIPLPDRPSPLAGAVLGAYGLAFLWLERRLPKPNAPKMRPPLPADNSGR